jgi:16S rRNA (guanine527-N7)-methyltransferase
MTTPGRPHHGLDVSRETLVRLHQYCDLVKKWNPAINLIAKSTVDDIWNRHILDSADLLRLAGLQQGHWVDLGSGGGFPAIVVAIIAAEAAPQVTFTLIESDLRKGTFLRTVARETGTPMTVISQRIKDIPDQNADVISARAVAPLTKLLGYASQHLAPSGQCLFQKGRSWQNEIDEALENWRFSVETIPSQTNPESAVLKVRDISRA